MNYFDYNATHPLLPEARQAWLEAAGQYWANPSSVSGPASRARLHLAECREIWANHFRCRPENVVFTAGATEATNAILAHVARKAPAEARVLLSPFEHPAVIEPALAHFGGRVDFLPQDDAGAVDPGKAEALLEGGGYVLGCLMAANNETGLLQPVARMAKLCQRHRCPLLVDAAQWIGKMPPAQELQADYLTISGHKFGGPRGSGVLILSDCATGFRGRRGGGQEQGRHAGTENVEAISALTAALKAQPSAGWKQSGTDAFMTTLEGAIYRVIGGHQARLPNTLSLLLPRYRATRWLPRLEKHGYIVSTGAACATGKESPSHVLKALGLSDEEASRVIRISGGPETDEALWLGLRAALDTVLAELDDDDEARGLVTVIDPDAL